MIKLSDYLVSFFENHGVKDVFMLTGGGCMHLQDSFGRSKRIKYTCTEHEQAASMAAEAYSKMKNAPVLVLTTSGPGATNTLTGMLDCWQDSTPVIFIYGQAKSSQTVRLSGVPGLRQFGVQEADIISVVTPMTKFAVEVDDAKKIRFYLEKAVHEATSGRPGPVALSIPLDIQGAMIDEVSLDGYTLPDEKPPKPSPSEQDVSYVLEALTKAERPVIVAGHGIRLAGACDSLKKFVGTHDIPVVMSFMGVDTLDDDDPCCIGRIGSKGSRAGNIAMQNADLLLSLGCRLSVSDTGHEYDKFAREAKVIAVDVDATEHCKNTVKLDRVVISDAGQFIAALDKILEPGMKYTSWRECCTEWKKRYPVIMQSYPDDSKGMNYYAFLGLLNKFSRGNTPFVSDAGSAFYVTAQAMYVKSGQRHITTGGTATMGFTLPAAIGVAVAAPEQTVIGITGEGSFMQNMQELETVVFHNYDIKLFVVENGGYFSIHQTQKRYFNGNYVGESSSSGVSFTRLDMLAKAFGIRFFDLPSVDAGLKLMPEILGYRGPALIRVSVTPDMEIVPTVSSKMSSDGKMV
ncbi:MAG: thiamine pyrophosphate-binding protein, partial [Treponema sp.]|nr:thiamine pyrophosphate-binding protein [Treponema sp.]